MAITLEAIRAAGGIVHSDGNIFFRDISMLHGLAGAAPAAVAPQGVVAWMTPEGDRVVTAETMDGARKDGGASLSSLRPYTVALVRGGEPAAATPALEAPAAPAGDLALIIAALEHGQPQMAHYAEPCERHAKALAAARRMAAAPQAPAAPAEATEAAGKAHDWRDNASYGGETCAECGATKGSRRGNAPCTWPPAKTAKRWPFLESPGEFTARLEAAIRSFGSLLPAVRNVLIERPPTLAAAPAAPAVDESFEDLISDWAHGDALDAEHYRTLSQAARDVLAERRRQVNAEGFSPERDDQYVGGQLAGAAISYLILAAGGREDEARAFWPWRQEWLKPGSQRRYLEKACALGLAEMERMDRSAALANGGNSI